MRRRSRWSCTSRSTPGPTMSTKWSRPRSTSRSSRRAPPLKAPPAHRPAANTAGRSPGPHSGPGRAQLPERAMDTIHVIPSNVAFTDSVKAVQARKGSRQAYARMEEARPWRTTITPDLAHFIAAQTSVFLATANAQGQPYIQHRGGPPGFLHVLDDKTIGFADFVGNRQYITTGNLADNPKAHLFLIDYAQQRRIKIWGQASVDEGDAELIAKLLPRDYKARADQAILFTVSA